MNFSELFKLGSKILSDNGVEDYDFDAMCLIEHAFGFNRNQYFLNRKATVEEKEKEKFLSLLSFCVLLIAKGLNSQITV